MKTAKIFIMAIIVAMTTTSAMAQNGTEVIKGDTLIVVNRSNKVVKVEPSKKFENDTIIVTEGSDCLSDGYRPSNETVVALGPVKFQRGSDRNETLKKKKSRGWRFDNGRYAGFNLNFNGLVQSLSQMSLPEEADYMALSPKSIGIDFNFMDFVIASNGHTSLVTGLGLECNNFRFENNVTLMKDAHGNTVPDYSYDERGVNLSKTKLTTTYLNMPLLLQINLGNRPWKKNQVWISGGLTGGVLLQSHTKIKSSETGKHKVRNAQNIRQFHWGYMASVGYGDLAVTAKYYPQSIFRDNKGPKVEQVSIGIGVIF